MEISVKYLVELVMVVLIIKLIVGRWKPPIQESLQAILCLGIGVLVGTIFDPTSQGVITALIASGVAFYGGDLIHEFKTVKREISSEDSPIK